MSKTSVGSGKVIYQKTIPLILMALLAALQIFDFYIPNTFLKAPVQELVKWGNINAQWVLMYSFVFLFIVHIRRIIRPPDAKSRPYARPLSTIFALSFLLLLVYALIVPGGQNNVNFNTIWMYIIGYASAGVYYVWITMGYQSYQFLRFTSLDGSIFVITWFFTMTKETPVFPYLNKFIFNDIAIWFESTIGMNAQRGMVIAAGVGVVIIIIRALMLREPGIIGMGTEG